MNRSTSRIVTSACALLLAQLAMGSAEAEAQQESSAVREVPKPVLPEPVSLGTALSDVSRESFADRRHDPVAKTPGHGAGSEADGPSCGDDTCGAGENECNCPQDCPGVCPCVLFDNEAEFVAVTTGQGNELNALETFEASILPPAESFYMDDALRGGVPNLPNGFPYPNGIDVRSLCVQSNVLGGAPTDKSPRGIAGLVAVSAGVLDTISDIVVAGTPSDSLDLLIIEPGYLAVGFDTISLLGADITEIRVYGRDNTTMLVAGTSSADDAGSNFFGVSCSVEIGRINLFDTADGYEGGDDIQMWGLFEPAECGNGECEVGESCGAPEDPPPVCVEDCGTCFCGDGVVNKQGEECDAPDDAECPGKCIPPGMPDECTCPRPPAAENDDCQDAIPIFDGTTDYDTTGTSTDGLQHDDCMFCGQTHHDIWYQYEATCTGVLHVSMCEDGGDALYDTDLVVYNGCFPAIPCLAGDAFLLGCSDDDCTAPSGQHFISRLPNSTGNPWPMNVVQGNCYTIRVGGWENGDQGPGTVGISCRGICGDGTCNVGEDECNCPEDCSGQCPCQIFTDVVEFEAFNIASGNTLISMEDFEESELPPASSDGFDDPLCAGVPNLPDGFPFPDGLGALTLCIQSNFHHTPAEPNPRGTSGLSAASAGYSGAVSDVVVAGVPSDSLDLMFTSIDHIGVGFSTISSSNGGTVEILVFDKNNELLLTSESPADDTGANFWGISCMEIVERINIFDDTGIGTEGADNIQLWVHGDPCGSCPTDVDGSGATTAFDLAFLLGSWGPVTPESQCLDADGNGVIDAFDLAVLLGVWGVCL